MNEPNFCLSKITHVGFVVKDLEATTSYFSEVFGIGPFKIVESNFLKDTGYFEKKYKGKDEDFMFRFGKASLGAIDVEIIQPLKGRSVYDDFIKERGGGLHHLAFEVENLDLIIRKLENYRVEVVQSGKRIGLSWAYVEVGFMNGLIIELMEKVN